MVKGKHILLILLLIPLISLGQVPDTETFSLQDVVDYISPSNNTLIGCHNDADPLLYDINYVGDTNSLYSFRNYGPKDLQLIANINNSSSETRLGYNETITYIHIGVDATNYDGSNFEFIDTTTTGGVVLSGWAIRYPYPDGDYIDRLASDINDNELNMTVVSSEIRTTNELWYEDSGGGDVLFREPYDALGAQNLNDFVMNKDSLINNENFYVYIEIVEGSKAYSLYESQDYKVRDDQGVAYMRKIKPVEYSSYSGSQLSFSGGNGNETYEFGGDYQPRFGVNGGRSSSLDVVNLQSGEEFYIDLYKFYSLSALDLYATGNLGIRPAGGGQYYSSLTDYTSDSLDIIVNGGASHNTKDSVYTLGATGGTEFSFVMNYYQESIDPFSISAPQSGGTYDVDVYTHPDYNWNASKVDSQADWVSLYNTPSGTGDGYFSVSIANNDTGLFRSTEVDVTFDSGQTITLSITQSG